jgi:hypothetical protein
MQLTGGDPGGVRFAHALSFKRRPQLISVFYGHPTQCGLASASISSVSSDGNPAERGRV